MENEKKLTMTFSVKKFGGDIFSVSFSNAVRSDSLSEEELFEKLYVGLQEDIKRTCKVNSLARGAVTKMIEDEKERIQALKKLEEQEESFEDFS